MATIQDQIATARAAGYSDSDISAKLSTMPGYDDKIKAATGAGYSPSDIVSHLSGAATQTPAANATNQSEGAAQGQRIMDDVNQINHESGNLFTGAGETALNMASGIGSSIVGGWRGLAKLATGGSLDDAVKASQDIQQDYTYQPRTGVGKLGSEILSLPVNIAKSAATSMGGDIGQAVNGDQGRIAGEAIGNVLPDVATTLMGGRAAFKGLSPVDAHPGAANAARAYADHIAPESSLDTPAYARQAAVAPDPSAPTSALSNYLKDRTFMQSLSEQDRSDLLGHYQVAQNPSALDQIRSNAKSQASEIVGRNLADRVPVTDSSAPLLPPVDASPIADTVAALRNTDDISATLKAFGVDDGESLPAASPESVQRTPMPGPQPKSALSASDDAAIPQNSAIAPFEPSTDRHVDPALRDQNLQVLRDAGLENIRESAITGDAATAAREYQHGKFTSEPAGQYWNDQFQSETGAMKNYAQQLIDETNGRTGLDESAMTRKGMDIAAPYDAARGYFEGAKKNLYDIANKRAEETGIPVGTASVDALLADPDFRATLMAKDQQGLLNTIQSQYDRFKALDTDGLSVANAEKFRKWLNKVWSPDKSGTLGEVKGALDNDVFKSAGEDVYAAGRQMHIMEKQTLDNPNGIAKLMDSDPNTPVNRNTDYHKIPDKIMTISEDQFKHIIDTYRGLPPELQPLAQKAIATLKAHYAERFLNAGTETGQGNPRQLWNAGGVKTFASDNSAKLPMLFTAEEMQRIRTMLKAGDILRVNPAYPGAAAQLSNASRSGLMSKVINKIGGGLGGVAGASVAGPFGAGAGALAGNAISDGVLSLLGERRALEKAKAAVIKEYTQKATKAGK